MVLFWRTFTEKRKIPESFDIGFQEEGSEECVFESLSVVDECARRGSNPQPSDPKSDALSN
jgi:hypothetical protein